VGSGDGAQTTTELIRKTTLQQQ